jgi:hypothetical protein
MTRRVSSVSKEYSFRINWIKRMETCVVEEMFAWKTIDHYLKDLRNDERRDDGDGAAPISCIDASKERQD